MEMRHRRVAGAQSKVAEGSIAESLKPNVFDTAAVARMDAAVEAHPHSMGVGCLVRAKAHVVSSEGSEPDWAVGRQGASGAGVGIDHCWDNSDAVYSAASRPGNETVESETEDYMAEPPSWW